MSSISVFSKFGTTLNDPTGSLVGVQGPPGVGFVLTPGGNYDIQNKDFENVDNIEVNSITAQVAPIMVNSDIEMGIAEVTDLRLPSIATDESITTLLTLDGDVVKKRTTIPNRFDQELNTFDSPQFVGLNLSGVALDATETQLLCLDSITNDIVYRNTFPNPFDQDLNTTDNVKFASIATNDYKGEVDSATFLTFVEQQPAFENIFAIGAGATSIGSFVAFPGVTAPTASDYINANGCILYHEPSVGLHYLSLADDVILNDPFDQQLNTTDDVTFNSVTAGTVNANFIATNTNPFMEFNSSVVFNNPIQCEDTIRGNGQLELNALALDNSATTMLMLDGSNITVRRTTPINPFNQTLDTTSSPSFVGETLTGLSTDNAQTTMIMINGSNQLVKRTTAINPFNQSLNTTDSPTFGTITSSNHTLTGLSTDNAQTTMLMINGSNQVVKRTTAINPFDQTLNTTSDVQFNSMRVGNLKSSTTNATVLTIDPSAANIALSANVKLAVQAAMQLTQVASPGTPGGLTGYLWNNANVPYWTDTAGTTYNLVNNFNQTLNTSSNVVFNTVGANTSNITTGNFTTVNVDTLHVNNNAAISLASPTTITGAGNTFTVSGGNNLNLVSRGVTETLQAALVLDGSSNVMVKHIHTAFAESTGVSSSSDTVNFVTKVTLTVTTFAADYQISWSALVGNTSQDQGVGLQVQVDGVTINTSDMVKPKVANAANYIPLSGFFIRSLSAASHTITLQYRPNANTANIQDARLLIRQM